MNELVCTKCAIIQVAAYLYNIFYINKVFVTMFFLNLIKKEFLVQIITWCY